MLVDLRRLCTDVQRGERLLSDRGAGSVVSVTMHLPDMGNRIVFWILSRLGRAEPTEHGYEDNEGAGRFLI